MKLMVLLKDIFARLYLVYGLFALFLVFLWHNPAIMRNAVAQTVSRLTPPINYFKLFVEPQGNYDKDRLKDCIYYHQKVAYFFPFQSPEANTMLGFCYYRINNVARAVEAYQRSLELNPVYFWSYYNLGVISFKQEKYPEAYMYFRKATEQDLVKSMYIISNSKVYLDVISSDAKAADAYNPEQSVRRGYGRAYRGVMAALFKAERYNELLQFAIKSIADKNDENGVYYHYAGLAAFNLKAFDKAAILFEKAIELNQQNADAVLYLGLCLQAVGRNDIARGYMATASKLHAQYGSFADKYENFDVQLF